MIWILLRSEFLEDPDSAIDHMTGIRIRILTLTGIRVRIFNFFYFFLQFPQIDNFLMITLTSCWRNVFTITRGLLSKNISSANCSIYYVKTNGNKHNYVKLSMDIYTKVFNQIQKLSSPPKWVILEKFFLCTMLSARNFWWLFFKK